MVYTIPVFSNGRAKIMLFNEINATLLEFNQINAILKQLFVTIGIL